MPSVLTKIKRAIRRRLHLAKREAPAEATNLDFQSHDADTSEVPPPTQQWLARVPSPIPNDDTQYGIAEHQPTPTSALGFDEDCDDGQVESSAVKSRCELRRSNAIRRCGAAPEEQQRNRYSQPLERHIARACGKLPGMEPSRDQEAFEFEAMVGRYPRFSSQLAAFDGLIDYQRSRPKIVHQRSQARKSVDIVHVDQSKSDSVERAATVHQLYPDLPPKAKQHLIEDRMNLTGLTSDTADGHEEKGVSPFCCSSSTRSDSLTDDSRVNQALRDVNDGSSDTLKSFHGRSSKPKSIMKNSRKTLWRGKKSVRFDDNATTTFEIPEIFVTRSSENNVTVAGTPTAHETATRNGAFLKPPDWARIRGCPS